MRSRQQRISQNLPVPSVPSLIPMESTADYVRRRRLSKQEATTAKRKRFVKKLILAILPFTLILAGLTFVSMGVFRYIEQESLLSVFFEARKRPIADFNGVIWTPPTQPVTPPPTTVPEIKDGRLVTPFYYIGAQLGTLRLPRVQVDAKVLQGDSEAEFRVGVGHYTGSYLPGQGGNILLSGHRSMYLRNIEYAAVGDIVEFETTYGIFTYQVRTIKIIKDTDVSIAEQTGREILTMYTCYPFSVIGNSVQRFVVICDLIDQEVYT